MLSDAGSVMLVARRELRDQVRDWRIMLPLTVLTFAFPFLMNEVARQAVGFFARFGTSLIADRLVPFSILIIGFFPITVSLVVALESFVGEKERGTIEPLLNAPLKDWHLYGGKLIVGILTPLAASYASIGLYLLMVSRQHLLLPTAPTLLLLVMLTSVHALLMVSAALVISVQSTSIRAANLLASFVIVPVALMLQGESILLFWGTDRVLWLAVLAVVIMAALLVLLGIAHFRREYLIGRELDRLNARWVWQTFWRAFRGTATGLRSWYQVRVIGIVRQLVIPLSIVLVIAVAAAFLSYFWTAANVAGMLSNVNRDELASALRGARESAGIADLANGLTASRILLNNVRATTLVYLAGLVSFGVLGIAAFLLNFGLIGAVLGVFGLLGYSPIMLFLAGLLPHGIFEIPALLLVSAVVLRVGAVLVTPQAHKSMGQILMELLAESGVILVGVAWPLLAIAALIEAHITPRLLILVLR